MQFYEKIPVGISSCLLGNKVRYDGSHKHDAYITETLSRYFEFHPFCPEVAIGLGVPRKPIHLVHTDQGVRCQGVHLPCRDVSGALRGYARQFSRQQTNLCAYIVKRGSPSCGMHDVPVKNQPDQQGTGLFTQEIMILEPLMPVEEEGQLHSKPLRENFIFRARLLYHWKNLLHAGLSIRKLHSFHECYQSSCTDSNDCYNLKAILAGLNKNNLAQTAERYILQLMQNIKMRH